MREGFYAIRFRTADGQGSGVLVLEGGRMRGGDSRMAYSGRYTMHGDMLSADLTVRTHTDNPKMSSLFGPDEFTLALHGNFAKDPPEIMAVSPNVGHVDMSATLHRLED